jgi:hypothetical protein
MWQTVQNNPVGTFTTAAAGWTAGTWIGHQIATNPCAQYVTPMHYAPAVIANTMARIIPPTPARIDTAQRFVNFTSTIPGLGPR